mmetsp:Transcript_39827/g.86835  ORF Transcript_39827/g.86835 Transcript_39827/m.86835 type:complete len:116 (-) Transcript_39827:212-559(-)
MDVFDWSIPFLAENITAVMKILLGGSDNKLSKDEENKFKGHVMNKVDQDFNKKAIIKKKIKFVGRLVRIFSNLRNNNLITGSEKNQTVKGQVTEESMFKQMSRSDARNEMFPGNK